MAPVSIQSILKCFIGRREAEIAENGQKYMPKYGPRSQPTMPRMPHSTEQKRTFYPRFRISLRIDQQKYTAEHKKAPGRNIESG
jgi:hypothetical protein